MKVLILGSKGQLGRCLSDQFGTTNYEFMCTSREEIDITDFEDVKEKITDINPNVIINASAYTAVDKAEGDEHAANLINHLAVANIADTCNELGCWLIHVSTDYVFDGTANSPYRETDITNPQGVYGISKLSGEYAIQSSGCKYLILRTSWVFSEYGNNFMKTMLRLGTEQDEVSIVGDQVGCPTYAQDIAKAIVFILDYLADETIVGVYHFSGGEQCSWFHFGREIFEKAGKVGFLVPNNLQSISAREYSTAAKRPGYSVLDTHKALKVFGLLPSDWKAGISNVLRKLQMKS